MVYNIRNSMFFKCRLKLNIVKPCYDTYTHVLFQGTTLTVYGSGLKSHDGIVPTALPLHVGPRPENDNQTGFKL